MHYDVSQESTDALLDLAATNSCKDEVQCHRGYDLPYEQFACAPQWADACAQLAECCLLLPAQHISDIAIAQPCSQLSCLQQS